MAKKSCIFVWIELNKIILSDKSKLIMAIDRALLYQIDDFRFANLISTHAEAVRYLLTWGLGAAAIKGERPIL